MESNGDEVKVEEIKFSGGLAVEIFEFLVGFTEIINEQNVRVKGSEIKKGDDEWISVEYLNRDFKTLLKAYKEVGELAIKVCELLIEEKPLAEAGDEEQVTIKPN